MRAEKSFANTHRLCLVDLSGILKENNKMLQRPLSKSKLMAFRQCPKRLWLEVHQPELRKESDQTQASFEIGTTVGELARKIYDPKGKGQTVDLFAAGVQAAFDRTRSLLENSNPVFEAGFAAEGAMAFADVLLPVRKGGAKAWKLVEVKSSTSVKDCYRDDVAIQAFVARQAGLTLASVSLAHIDSDWVYPGGGDYSGLLFENDLTDETFARSAEVVHWIASAHQVVAEKTAPKLTTGTHCSVPYDCGFQDHCASQEPRAQYPVNHLPRLQSKAVKALLEDRSVIDMRHVPDALLNEVQLRVKANTIAGQTFFDAAGAAEDLAAHRLPAIFIDFETTQFAVPVWKGTRPYQQLPFQFSVHRLSRTGKLTHDAFLSLSGKDPSREFADALIGACGNSGPVFVYNAAFETTRIRELATRFRSLAPALLAINMRVVDLHPIARQRYYHPSQQGSWSIKMVLPAIAPDLNYDQLDGVQNGGMAMEAYREAISPSTSPARKAEIEAQLMAYCRLDTYAMVRLWQFLAGRQDLRL